MNSIKLKSTIIVCLTLVGLYGLAELFFARFTFSFPTFQDQCLYARMFIVDKRDKDIKRGDLVAFKFNKEDKNFDKGLSFIKIAAGVPGDEIKYSPNEMYVNRVESEIAGMTHAINFLQLNPKEYERQITLNENEFFMVGETIYSYDSRFWGPINEEDILGKAYAIF